MTNKKFQNYLSHKFEKVFFPFRLSSEPCETPIIKIKNKQINGEIVKYEILNAIIEQILQNKKKIKE